MFYHKRVGETTSEFAKRISELHGGLKTCACGKLDPMARGMTRVLVGKETKQMDQHLQSDKIYEFYIVPGISTDSDDIMGLIDATNDMISVREIHNIKQYMDTKILNLERQKFHHYSAIKLRKNDERQSLWYWHKKGMLDDSEIPDKPVEVYNLEFLEFKSVDVQDYLVTVVDNLNKITRKNQFRIEEIIQKWIGLNYNRPLFMLKFRMKVSSGFYIRMIAKQMKADLGIPVHIYDIHRVGVD